MAEKPAFRESWNRSRRCLVPANGFYEWAKGLNTSVKQPYYIKHKNNDMLLFAGLWSKVDDQVSFTILTKQADENLSHLHHRSPVMVDENKASEWFLADMNDAQALIRESTTRILQFHKVGSDVGKVANDHAGLIAAPGTKGSGVLF